MTIQTEFQEILKAAGWEPTGNVHDKAREYARGDRRIHFRKLRTPEDLHRARRLLAQFET
jgi:hypothetical protein